MAAASPRFANQVAIVTGGADGLGKGITERLASEGAAVVIFDVNAELIAKSVEAFHASGLTSISGAQVDVASEPAVAAAINEVATKHGRLDILINCAGIVGERSVRRIHRVSLPLSNTRSAP